MSNIEHDEKKKAEAVWGMAKQQQSLYGPSWRWKMAGEQQDCMPKRFLKHYGEDFANVLHYRLLCRQSNIGQQHAANRYPLLAAAEELNADFVKTGHLKVGVLGDMDLEEISQLVQIDEAVIQTWERTFFDVRSALAATQWVNIHVIQTELAAGHGDLAARLRMVAAVGPQGARAILTADTRLPMHEAERLFDRDLKLHLKFDAAVKMTPDTEKTRLFFIKWYTELKNEKQRLQLAREKLQQKCEEAMDRCKVAKIQAELTLERERNRATALAARQTRRREAKTLIATREKQSHLLIAEHRREQEQAQQTALAARIAASPLSRLQWHRQEKLDVVPYATLLESAVARTTNTNHKPVATVLPFITASAALVNQPALA